MVATQLDGRILNLTNLDKPMFPTGFSKGEVLAYLLDVAGALLPAISDRCVTRVRFPDGTASEAFYEKNPPPGCPDWVGRQRVATSSGSEFLTPSTRPELAYLGNLGTLEFHAPQWRISEATDSPEGIVLGGDDEPRADTFVVDLDPGDGLRPADSARAAILAATALAELGLVGHVKTSGNKGLQISVPIHPTPCSEVHRFASAFSAHLASRHPATFVATMALEARRGKVYVDAHQNLASRNTIAAYSLRGVEQPSVATPLTWDELAAVDETQSRFRYSPAEVLERLDRLGDLWAVVHDESARQVLPAPPTD